jgi:hypothetical protein
MLAAGCAAGVASAAAAPAPERAAASASSAAAVAAAMADEHAAVPRISARGLSPLSPRASPGAAGLSGRAALCGAYWRALPAELYADTGADDTGRAHAGAAAALATPAAQPAASMAAAYPMGGMSSAPGWACR